MQGIVYRDVKLENTLLDGNDPPVVQLCDFGVARCESRAGCQPCQQRLMTRYDTVTSAQARARAVSKHISCAAFLPTAILLDPHDPQAGKRRGREHGTEADGHCSRHPWLRFTPGARLCHLLPLPTPYCADLSKRALLTRLALPLLQYHCRCCKWASQGRARTTEPKRTFGPLGSFSLSC